ncbi:unnamed protein product [Rotaria socialis]|uniref:Uncharacterized protein n=1 Tax=Rotaria socialis TaxID=392032 RepID=A0A820VMN1_9BILA|nr:unnamed protein product [Rotaria socialis]CAF4504166.1 unnamed protein product [Rotaria socialis]
MNYIRIYDNETKQTTRLLLKQDNIIRKDYFVKTFPGATGILFKDEQSNEFVSIPEDSDGNFQFEWDKNVLYELNSIAHYKNRCLASSSALSSAASSSNKLEFPNWLKVAAGIIVMRIWSIIPSLWSNIYEEVVIILGNNS